MTGSDHTVTDDRLAEIQQALADISDWTKPNPLEAIEDNCIVWLNWLVAALVAERAETQQLRNLLPTWWRFDPPIGDGQVFGFQWALSQRDLVEVDQSDIIDFAVGAFREAMRKELDAARSARAGLT